MILLIKLIKLYDSIIYNSSKIVLNILIVKKLNYNCWDASSINFNNKQFNKFDKIFNFYP